MNSIDLKNSTETLLTNRLILRKFVRTDAQAMYRNWASDPEVTKYLTWSPHTDVSETETIVSSWVDGYRRPHFYQWAITLKGTEVPIGSIGLVNYTEDPQGGEIGYCLGSTYWQRGYMTEALSAVIRYLIGQCGFKTLEAKHDIRNPNSGKVMRKAGMLFSGTYPNSGMSKEGTPISYDCYYIDAYHLDGVLSTDDA